MHGLSLLKRSIRGFILLQLNINDKFPKKANKP